MWSQQEFSGSYSAEFEYYPLACGKHAGGTFFQLAGQSINPRDNYDFMASAVGNMDFYNFGIKCYHFSFFRGDSYQSVCNFRKTGREFYLLAQVPDPVPRTEQWYHLRFEKNHRQFSFFVDDKLVLEYFDQGNQGEVLDAGKFGIRNWGRHSAWFRNFKVMK